MSVRHFLSRFRCRATWGHYAAGFTQCERYRFHRGDHRWMQRAWDA